MQAIEIAKRHEANLGAFLADALRVDAIIRKEAKDVENAAGPAGDGDDSVDLGVPCAGFEILPDRKLD
jgi:hypothetical protein